MRPANVNPALVFSHFIDLPAPGEPLDPKTIPTHGGVYAFADHTGRIIQTITTQNLRRSATLRLQPPDPETHQRRADIHAIARRLWWRPAHSVFETNLIYLDITRRLTPDTYREHLGFAPAWFATVTPSDRLPRWRPANLAFQPGDVEIGPFPRRRQCTEYIALLEDLFDLCREHHILDQTPNATACTYHDIGRCPAPCDGTIPLDQYRATIQASIRFASGSTAERFDELELAMRTAAETRAYTLAARIRETVAGARDFLRRHASMCVPANEFQLLVVQRSRRRSRVKPFFVDRGSIQFGDAVPLAELSTVADEWLARLRNPRDEQSWSARKRSECVWLVSRFLAKGNDAPGVFLRKRDARTADNLARAIERKFATGKKCASDKRAESK